MTTYELSNEFDLRWDNLRYNNSGYASLNEYEKSLYLTQAQELLFNQLYNKFDQDEFTRRALAPLVKTYRDSFLSESDDQNDLSQGIFTSISVFLPEDASYILTEQFSTLSGKTLNIRPIKLDHYNRVKDNPFVKPNKNEAWRTDLGYDYNYKTENEEELSIPNSNNKLSSIELLTSYTLAELDSYYCRYLMYPTPIILEDIDDANDYIRDYSKITEAVLNNIVHEQLVDLAVEIATKSLYSSQQK